MIDFLDIDLYKTTFVFVVGVSVDEWNEFYKKYKDKLSEDDNKIVIDTIKDKSYGGACIQTDENDYVIYIRNADSHGDISHEIFHACNKLLTRLEFTHDDVAEAWAYLIGYVTEHFYDMIANNKKGSD